MLNVLIVDDEPWSRQVIRHLGTWEAFGMQIAGEADDGTEGLRLVEKLRPDIVVTDMRMPGLDGVALLEKLNSLYPEVQIIVMSGYDDFVYLKQAIRSRAAEYLLKPVDPEELNAVLALCAKECERRRKAASPVMFMEDELLERYMAYRQRVYNHMLELNKPAVVEELDKLGQELERSVPSHQVEAMTERISRDLLLLAEEIAGGSGALSTGGGIPASEGTTVQELVRGLKTLYTEIINITIAQRKNRVRLDLGEVQRYIGQHFYESVSLESIALHFMVTKEHLSRAYKAATGETVSDSITRLRMERARVLITQERMAIKDAAGMSGYEDLPYFYRVFKKHFGFPPGELRNDK
jgi:two-component system response regulator YesN